MTKYHISPAGVKSTLSHTVKEAGEFETVLKPLGPAATAGATSLGGSGPVVAALSDLFTDEGERMKRVGTRVNACVRAAAEATQAYVAGDQEMSASTRQRATIVDRAIQKLR